MSKWNRCVLAGVGPGGLALVLLMGACPCGAQDLNPSGLLTVEECVAIALDRSDLLGQAEGGLQSARGSYWTQYQSVLPRVSASAGWRREFADYIAVTGIQYVGSMGLRVDQNLLTLEGIQGIRSSKQALRAARADLAATRDEVEVTARGQFYACVAALRLADVEESAVALAQEQLRRSETLFRLGSVARSDVLQAQVNLAEAAQIATQRRNGVRVEVGRLALVMGLDPRTKLAIDSSLVAPEEPPAGELDDWVERAMGARPDLRAAEARLRAAEISKLGAQYQRLPTISASASWNRSARDLEDEFLRGDHAKYDNSWSLSVGVSLSLFNGLLTEGRIESAKGECRTRQEALERLQKDIALDVANAFLDIYEEIENLKAARSSVSLAAENLRLQQALYESGAGTLLEWDNARLDLRRARVTLIQAEISLLLAHARFRSAIAA